MSKFILQGDASGKLHRIDLPITKPTKTGDDFTFRTFALEVTDGEYKNYIQLQLNQDDVNLLDTFSVGQEVLVQYSLRGRNWTNPEGQEKTFNSVICRKILLNTNNSMTLTEAEDSLQTKEENDLPW